MPKDEGRGPRRQAGLLLAGLFWLCLSSSPPAPAQPAHLANCKTYRATYSVTITNVGAEIDTLAVKAIHPPEHPPR